MNNTGTSTNDSDERSCNPENMPPHIRRKIKKYNQYEASPPRLRRKINKYRRLFPAVPLTSAPTGSTTTTNSGGNDN
ncbi:hypothetical protein EST38_g6666 [Candolleomyces aberdarensis]|uniref:Uncharacterized protein n=1 Tax=Candolleomyces aberdarensis TaxID=2316362 RepID=A0A4Q2DH79_9AGAR|nr:hypothetical protein EST38_g6666 [Candolleomyces aberdarensis]